MKHVRWTFSSDLLNEAINSLIEGESLTTDSFYACIRSNAHETMDPSRSLSRQIRVNVRKCLLKPRLEAICHGHWSECRKGLLTFLDPPLHLAILHKILGEVVKTFFFFNKVGGFKKKIDEKFRKLWYTSNLFFFFTYQVLQKCT